MVGRCVIVEAGCAAVGQSDPNRGRVNCSRLGKPNPADTEPYPATSPEGAEATRAGLAAKLLVRQGQGTAPGRG